jgi:integrase
VSTGANRILRVVRKAATRSPSRSPRRARALDTYIGDRAGGPIFLTMTGGRMDRCGADGTVKRLVRRAGIAKRFLPHTLRDGFVTAALDAASRCKDVREAASHADPRTTNRYDRARQSLDRHAAYIVAAFVAGAAR